MRLGSLLWKGRPALGIVSGDRVLVVTELGASEAAYSSLRDAADARPLFLPLDEHSFPGSRTR